MSNPNSNTPVTSHSPSLTSSLSPLVSDPSSHEANLTSMTPSLSPNSDQTSKSFQNNSLSAESPRDTFCANDSNHQKSALTQKIRFQFEPKKHSAQNCYDYLAELLVEAAKSQKPPFHIMTIANIDLDGLPDVRSVVLRHFDPVRRVVHFHTDIRSPKVKQLQAHAKAKLMFYDPILRHQLRIPVTVTVHHQDDLTMAWWQKAQSISRVCYATPFATGQELSLEDSWQPPLLVHADNLSAYSNFCLIECVFDTIDYLQLCVGVHQRYLLSWVNKSDDNNSEGNWQLKRITP